MNRTLDSEIITNPDGSIYHLNLLPHQIATDIITVGDPDRVKRVTDHFEEIEHIVSKREFTTHTGKYKGKRLTVISTGIGTDNIDIVFNELEALANYNLKTKKRLETFTPLKFYRIGTSGALIDSVALDSVVISSYGIGLDGLMHFYDYNYDIHEKEIAMKVNKRLHETIPTVKSYVCQASESLVKKFSPLGKQGFTITATGFYGPQGRMLLARPKSSTFLDDMRDVAYEGQYITNLEMETAGIYGMANILGHEAISLNAILANRAQQTFSSTPKETVDRLIIDTLEIIAS